MRPPYGGTCGSGFSRERRTTPCRPKRLTFACMCLLAASVALAQEPDEAFEPDPLLAGYAQDAEPAAWQPFGDSSLSFDRVTGLPGAREVERLRGRLRLGLRRDGDDWSAAFAGKAGAGSDRNADNRRNNDNEASDGVALDQAWLRWQPSDATAITIGQQPLPLQLTPLTWDRDLRPRGISLEQQWPLGDFDRLRLALGHYAGNHLYGDRSGLTAAQLGWHYQEGAPFAADIQLGWLGFDRLQRATAEGLTRGNRQSGGRLRSGYRLLDLQFGLRWERAGGPLALRADLLRNLGADDLDRGGRLSLIHGHADRLGGWEFGFAWQRIQRDAAMAAFNSDDWWFHSAARGGMPWLSYGFLGGWTLQVSGFLERADGRDERVRRLLVELRSGF
jgi:hypothetical protein